MAVSNYKSKSITVYDENLILIKTVLTIDNNEINPFGITSNDLNRIYISDDLSSSVIQTDFNFNKIKSFDLNDRSCGGSFKPNGLCYGNNFIYVCDHDNKKIFKLTADLEFNDSYSIDYEPRSIKIIEKTLCVRRSFSEELYFYDADNFAFKCKHEDELGMISTINSMFFKCGSSSIYCYDINGNLVGSFSIGSLKYHRSDGFDGVMAYHGENLVIAFWDKSKLCAFELLDWWLTYIKCN